jgi:hypothetical protein
MKSKRIARIAGPTIYPVRGQRVMLDSDLARIYEVFDRAAERAAAGKFNQDSQIESRHFLDG